MTKSEIRAWKSRWKAVNEFTIREARGSTPDQRLMQLEGLYHFARQIGITEKGKQVEEARQRWIRLKGRLRPADRPGGH